MKKYIVTAVFVFTILMFFSMSSPMMSMADWWVRPTAIPTQPSFDRDLPTPAVQPTAAPTSAPTNAPTSAPTSEPTNPPSVPTATPRVGGPTSPPPTPGKGSSDGSVAGAEDPCAPGKSYEGQYCGWSPKAGGEGGGGVSSARVGGPQVLGLSDTSSGNLALSDIMILAGVLCLLVYARSKLAVGKSR